MPTSTQVRGLDAETLARLKRGAQARGWTMAEMIRALVLLHDRMRALADTETPDGRWGQIAVELEALGLTTVRA